MESDKPSKSIEDNTTAVAGEGEGRPEISHPGEGRGSKNEPKSTESADFPSSALDKKISGVRIDLHEVGPQQSQGIPKELNMASSSEVLNSEISLEKEYQVGHNLNDLNATAASEMNGEPHLISPENTSYCGIEGSPIDKNRHVPMNTESTIKTRSRTIQVGQGILPDRGDDIVVQLSIPANFSEHRWTIASGHNLHLGTSGFSYFGGMDDDGKMCGFGRLMLGDREQYMEGIWRMNRLIDLNISQLNCEPGNQTYLIFKRQDDYLLSTHESNCIAIVNFNEITELDFTASVADIKQLFFRKIRILRTIVDELEHKGQASLNQLVALLGKAVNVDADPIVRANTLILVCEYLQKLDTDISNIFCDGRIPLNVEEAAADFLMCENHYLNVFKTPSKVFRLRQDLRKVLNEVYHEGLKRYREVLIDKCPSGFPDLLKFVKSVSDRQLLYVTCEDMKVFNHLTSQVCFEHFKPYFMDLAKRFCLTIENLETSVIPSKIIPVMPPIYGFIVKSFWEVVSGIVQVAGTYEYKDMLFCESGNWKIQGNIKWPNSETRGNPKVLESFNSSTKKSSLYHRALEVQYNFLHHMMGFFSPENYVVEKKYELKFHVLEENLTSRKKSLLMAKQTVGLAKRLENLRPERIVWLWLLDHTIHGLFKDDDKYQILLKPYKTLLEGNVSHMERSLTESHEAFRVMTHSIVKFITSTAPYFKEAEGTPGIDVEILVQQMWTFSNASQEMETDPSRAPDFRDLISEYNRYLSLRQCINIEMTTGHFSNQITQMMQTFMRIVVTSLRKKVPTTTLVTYLRSLNGFLDDFKNIDFLSNWFVKSKFFDSDILEKVDNKLSAGSNCSYRVIDIETFVQVVKILKNAIPQHYIIQVVNQLLDCIEICLNKQWQSANVGLGIAQLECTSALLDAIRRSFMYLKEQPDYVDFETFKKETVGPFVCLVNDCSALSDLKLRTANVQKSFWYIRKMDEIGIDQALKMFKKVNTCPVSNKLLECYNVYLSKYNELIANYNSHLLDGKSHAEGLEEVKQVLGKGKTLHFSMWTEEFKTKEIPVLLAGLGAVWSILASKDISSSDKFLKPHCIQILCVLRLLSIEESKGAENHLAQVLTGQGKSLILGLLSSILAMTGHKVKVLCYSEYLSARDQSDSDEFFKTFQVQDQIEYGTFEDVADNFLQPEANGVKSSLCQLVEDEVLKHSTLPRITSTTSITKNTVLLIDEVDVFFTEMFFGNTYNIAVIPAFCGLARVQEEIWYVSSTLNNGKERIVQCTNRFIIDQVATGNKEMLKFIDFLKKPGEFSLLKRDEHNKLSVTTYTNRSLFDEHLLLMVSDAISVRYEESARAGYKITDDGIISLRQEDGTYSESLYHGYQNIFNYFRLKGSNFDVKNFQNYGYFTLSGGEISYARLASQFQLILGVSGTLKNLSDYEKSAMKFYNITNFSILPSFFGDSNLLFNERADFHYFIKEQDWLKEIYDRANGIIESRRAVLIFFDLDTTIDVFTKEYKTKFDRMHEITENTSASLRDRYIDEAGLPGTVTLATRGMGRGVDYTSSLTVEKNGGVHVIQTFYSSDVKEETQIKGRTARKDNRGSYELIICREHLVRDEIIFQDDSNVHNYTSLDRIRKYLANKKGETLNAEIEKCEHNHTTTMKYFGLLQDTKEENIKTSRKRKGEQLPSVTDLKKKSQ